VFATVSVLTKSTMTLASVTFTPNLKMIIHFETLEQCVRRPDPEQKPPSYIPNTGRKEPKEQEFDIVFGEGGGKWVSAQIIGPTHKQIAGPSGRAV
jgi:hypothetical protein